MSATGAVVFLPREGTGPSRMLEELLFDPAALWLTEALEAAGVEQFFVVCHSDDREKAQTCFPEGTEFVTGSTGDALEQLMDFLARLEGKVLVFTRPVLLSWQSARQLVDDNCSGPLDNKDTGVCRIDAALLAQALADGSGLDEVLKENADKLGGRSIWYQSAAVLKAGPEGRVEAELTARNYGAYRLLESGVRIMDPNTCYVGPRVKVGEGTVILPGTILRGETVIGAGCELGPNSMVRDCTVGDNVVVNASQINESTVDAGTKIGPFAYIRPNCHVGANVKVGDFVELKNSTIGDGTKISHLTYVGDSDVGCRVNFGCGTVTVNYDGISKYRTTIGDDAFIGCNTNLVAPVRVGDGAYTAAGSTITDEVPADSLAIARPRQTVKKQWAARRRSRRK
ncbi:DapH/DapD/GlmU-related protein [uncultured Flavonifractor sp.]|uniref:DapH/DapD/GlmU-related protein n=1 Tax=uncultured Flavonifractor sp. TaxID=1193534 RepID=UPI00262A7A40|nr:DapH/DapD/GlmU-related protein [uncultured Flavonifractor sp.]